VFCCVCWLCCALASAVRPACARARSAKRCGQHADATLRTMYLPSKPHTRCMAAQPVRSVSAAVAGQRRSSSSRRGAHVDGGLEVARVAHHVGVGKVDADHVELAARDGLLCRVACLSRLHVGLLVEHHLVRRNLRTHSVRFSSSTSIRYGLLVEHHLVQWDLLACSAHSDPDTTCTTSRLHRPLRPTVSAHCACTFALSLHDVPVPVAVFGN
jgi:hypothetical protein